MIFYRYSNDILPSACGPLTYVDPSPPRDCVFHFTSPYSLYIYSDTVFHTHPQNSITILIDTVNATNTSSCYCSTPGEALVFQTKIPERGDSFVTFQRRQTEGTDPSHILKQKTPRLVRRGSL